MHRLLKMQERRRLRVRNCNHSDQIIIDLIIIIYLTYMYIIATVAFLHEIIKVTVTVAAVTLDKLRGIPLTCWSVEMFS